MFQLFSKHLTGYRAVALRAPILIVLEVLCELALPLVMAEMLSVAIAQGDVAYLFRLGGLMALLALAAMALGVLAAHSAAVGSQGFGANLRQSLFDRVQEFSFADIDRFSSASLITRTTNDVNVLTMMLAMGLRMLVRAPVMLVVTLVVVFSLNARLALVLAAIVPVIALSVGILMLVSFRLFTVLQEKIDGLNSTVQENLAAIRVVKAFVRRDYEGEKFAAANDALTRTFLSVGLRMITMMPIITLCLNGATVGILYFGGRMVMTEGFPLGDLTAFLNYIFQVLMSVMMVAMALIQFSRAQACVKRIQEVLDTAPSITDAPNTAERTLPAPRGEIEFRDVSFRYRAEGAGDEVLSRISFHVPPGSFVAVVGGTGTGKTSLVNLLPRFYDVTEGRVLVDGMDVRDYPIETLRRRIGMVLQTNLLFTGTVRENLLWGDEDATQEELVRAARDAQALDFVQSLPDGFDTRLDQGGVNLSGGQKQRLCIARAMLKKPAILVLDDSTSAVDSATEAAIRDSFRNNLKGTTVLIIAQRISSVRYADEIVVLDDGQVAGRGTHESLLDTCAVYREINQSQQEEVAPS